MSRFSAALTTALLFFACACGDGVSGEPAEYTYQIVNTFPHDPRAFTQGLEFRDGYLYESTGMNGTSSVRKVVLETGKVLQKIDIPDIYFGEGITITNNQIVELTWKSGKGFVYDIDHFKLLRSFDYPGEGWGLTHDAANIYMSDGSSQLRVWDPSTLQEKARITVRDRDRTVTELNELEYVRGEIYANVWQTERIVRINPKDGRVTGWIDCRNLLLPNEKEGTDVLNGIAYDAARDRLFVTGKLWPKLFEIKVVPKKQ